MDVATDFRLFMASVLALEELQKQSGQSLKLYQQELELFRRVPLQETSGIVAKVAASAPSERLTKYLQAGCWHEDTARLVAANLDSATRALWNHIMQAQVLLKELELLVHRASNVELSSQLTSLNLSKVALDAEEKSEADEQDLEGTLESQLSAPDYISMMTLILSMLIDDFKMQEKIIYALGLETPSEALSTYSLMWTLRPCLDDAVINQALSWIKS